MEAIIVHRFYPPINAAQEIEMDLDTHHHFMGEAIVCSRAAKEGEVPVGQSL
jgi:hypothetical protein